MHKILFTLLLTLTLSGAETISGTWSGELDAGAAKLTLVLHADNDAQGNLHATLDSVEQNMCGVAVDQISLQGGALHFEISALKARFEGVLQEGQIVGKFTQAGFSLPLTFRQGQVAKEAWKRPQNPQAPYPYQEEEVTYPSEGAILSGILTLPKGAGPFPVVLLIAGSGPVDRDETLFGHKPFWVWADYFTRRGIACLRVDKRGVGRSTGVYETATTVDFKKDVLAGVAYLKSRKEIDPKKIGLMGHSEGGVIAPMVAAESKDLAFLVLLGAPAVDGEQILMKQGEKIRRVGGVAEEVIQQERQLQAQLLSILKRESDREKASKEMRFVFDTYLANLSEEHKKAYGEGMVENLKRLNTEWFRYFIAFDPGTVLKQIHIPVLALNGEKDVQVDVAQNLPVLAKALEAAGNRDYTVRQMPGLNHLFQSCKTGSLTEYAQIEETVSPGVLELVGEWVHKRIKAWDWDGGRELHTPAKPNFENTQPLRAGFPPEDG